MNSLEQRSHTNIIDSFIECLKTNDIESLKRLLLNSHQLEILKNSLYTFGSLEETPLLHIACLNGSNDFVNILLRFGFNPNQKTSKGRQETALSLVVRTNESLDKTIDETKSKNVIDIIQLLLDFDADPTMTDILQWKPIHSTKEKKIMKMLLKKGEQIDSLGGAALQTPLMLASRKGNKELVEWLLKYHANPNICDKNGFYPIHHALGKLHILNLLTSSQLGNECIVRLLLSL